jgi:hypothetical protein
MTLMGRIAAVVSFAALVAIAIIFAKPLWEGAGAPLNADSQTLQASKSSDRLTANNASANGTLVPTTTIAAASGAAPSASAPAQQASLSPSPHEPQSTLLGQGPP